MEVEVDVEVKSFVVKHFRREVKQSRSSVGTPTNHIRQRLMTLPFK